MIILDYKNSYLTAVFSLAEELPRSRRSSQSGQSEFADMKFRATSAVSTERKLPKGPPSSNTSVKSTRQRNSSQESASSRPKRRTPRHQPPSALRSSLDYESNVRAETAFQEELIEEKYPTLADLKRDMDELASLRLLSQSMLQASVHSMAERKAASVGVGGAGAVSSAASTSSVSVGGGEMKSLTEQSQSLQQERAETLEVLAAARQRRARLPDSSSVSQFQFQNSNSKNSLALMTSTQHLSVKQVRKEQIKVEMKELKEAMVTTISRYYAGAKPSHRKMSANTHVREQLKALLQNKFNQRHRQRRHFAVELEKAELIKTDGNMQWESSERKRADLEMAVAGVEAEVQAMIAEVQEEKERGEKLRVEIRHAHDTASVTEERLRSAQRGIGAVLAAHPQVEESSHAMLSAVVQQKKDATKVAVDWAAKCAELRREIDEVHEAAKRKTHDSLALHMLHDLAQRRKDQSDMENQVEFDLQRLKEHVAQQLQR